MITSREQPKEISLLESEGTCVHTYRLKGLETDKIKAIFQRTGLAGEEDYWQALVKRFSGNPLMLKLIVHRIVDDYQGRISHYFAEEGDITLNEYPELHELIDNQFKRLSPLEQQLIYWLAIEREAVSMQELRDNFIQPITKGKTLVALDVLQSRSLLERSEVGDFMLQPAVLDVVTERFTDLVAQEILTDTTALLASHALLKARAKVYIRASQRQIILAALVQALLAA